MSQTPTMCPRNLPGMFNPETLKAKGTLVRLAGRTCCPFCGTSYAIRPPRKSHVIPNFFRTSGLVPGLVGAGLVDLTSGIHVQDTHRAWMLCRQCEVEQSVFENALSRSVKENGLVPRAFIASGDAFRASLCILWKTGVVLTEVTEEHGKRPVEWVTAQHARAFKGFMRDTKLYLKGEILSLLDEPNVRALHMPSWRKGTAFETTLPFILQNRRGMLVLGALVGQVVLVALISRPSDWDAWYSTSESRQKPHPEMQAMLKKVLENDMRAAFQAHVSKPT